MNYELAKKLKDAGFPQTVNGQYIGNVGGINEKSIYPGDVVGIAQEDFCYIPTLSELIEACGEEIYSLRRTYEKDKWVAHGYNLPNRDIEQIQFQSLGQIQSLGQKGFVGSTPEEAVTNLWLELNKK